MRGVLVERQEYDVVDAKAFLEPALRLKLRLVS